MKNKIPLLKCAFLPLAVASLSLASVSADAVLIDFNSYTADSNLAGQPSTGTAWSGGGSGWKIVANAGVGATKGVVSGTLTSGSATSTFSPSSTDLPGFDGTKSIVNVSFSFRFVDLPSSMTSTVAGIQFGYDGADATTAVRFYLTAEGRLGYGTGTLISNSVLDVNDTTTWTTIDARMNYGTQTFTFSINGTPYSTGGGTSVFAFRGASDASTIRLIDSGSANFKSVAFDNISMTVIPEPSSAALVLIPTVAGAALLLKRAKR